MEIAARLLPNEITAYGTMPMPTINVVPEVTVAPSITVEAPADSNHNESDYDDAMRSNCALSGSDNLLAVTRNN